MTTESKPIIKNVLVTGGAGFIGSHFVRKLVLDHPEYNIVNFDKLDYCATTNNNKDISRYSNYSFIQGDITIHDLVSFVIQQKKIDTIVHFAAQSHVDNSFGNSYDFTLNNIMGTHVMLENARIHKVTRFIHISTDEVYGEVEFHDNDLPEASILAPTNPYAASKAAAEMLVHSYIKSFKLPAIITRSNNVYGSHQYPEKVIPKFTSLLMNNKKCCIHGAGNNTRRYIHGTDVAEAVTTILHKGTEGEIYNIGTTNEVANIDLAKAIIRIVKPDCKNPEEWIEFVEDRLFNDCRYAVTSDKLGELGWAPKVDWETGLRQTVEWYQKNGATHWGDISHLMTPFPKTLGH